MPRSRPPTSYSEAVISSSILRKRSGGGREHLVRRRAAAIPRPQLVGWTAKLPWRKWDPVSGKNGRAVGNGLKCKVSRSCKEREEEKEIVS